MKTSITHGTITIFFKLVLGGLCVCQAGPLMAPTVAFTNSMYTADPASGNYLDRCIDGTGFNESTRQHIVSDYGWGAWLSGGIWDQQTADGWTAPFYIVFDLGGLFRLQTMWIWNYAQSLEQQRGIRFCRIEYSADGGQTYQTLYDNYELHSPFLLHPGIADGQYFDATDIVAMQDVAADHVKIVVKRIQDGGLFWADNGVPWTQNNFYGLSEVRFEGDPLLRLDPMPADGSSVSPDIVLTWTEAANVDAYDVYLDTSYEAVVEAGNCDVYPGRGRHYAAKCNPLFLERGKTYYWRVDTVQNNVPTTGTVWSFRVTSYIDSSCITATASSTYSGNLPIMTINNSGMDGPLHQNSSFGAYMWMTGGGTGEEWIEYQFDKVYYLEKMYVWNYSQFPCCPGRAMKNVAVYLYDGLAWTMLGNFTLTQPPGTDWYLATDVIDLQGNPAQKVRIKSLSVALGGSYGEGYRGLAEVKFTTAAPKASDPVYQDEGQTYRLRFTAGEGASNHRFYVGTSIEAVSAADINSPEYQGESSLPEFEFPSLTEGIDYYCRVDQIGAITTKGDVWVMTPGYTPVFFVAPDGSDSNPGTYREPFASIERAKLAVRQLSATRVLPQGEVIVYVRGGNYYSSQQIAFSTTDSGTADTPVVYRAWAGEEPRIIGGAALNPAWFTPVTSSSPVWSRVDTAARGNLVQVNLSSYGITDYGQFRDGQGYGRGLVSHMELFFNQKRMEVGRWPNANEYAQIANEMSQNTFVYSGTRPSRWLNAPDAMVTGYWQYAWVDAYAKISSINPVAKTITVNWWPYFGLVYPTKNSPWYALNLLEEIDSPGEWYMDRSSKILYLWPPDDLASAEIIVSMQGEGEKSLIRLDNTSYLTLEGLVIECGRYDGVNIYGGHHNTIKGCTIRNTGSIGVDIVGGHHNGVLNCHIHDTSNRGIAMTGGDRYTLTPCFNYAANNYIHDFSVWCRTYSPGIQLNGDGCRVSHNVIHSAPHSAIMTDEWYRQYKGSTNCIIEYNEIYDVCRDADDSAAVAWGWGWEKRGQIFRYNFVHDIHSRWGQWRERYHGVHGSYQDGCNSSVHYIGNIWYDIDNRGLMINGGRDNIVDNNIFCKVGLVPLSTVPQPGAIASNQSGTTEIVETPGSAMNMLERLLPFNHLIPPWSRAFPALTVIPNSYQEPAYSEAKKPKGNKLYRTLGYSNGVFLEDDPWPGNVFTLYWEMQNNIPNQNPMFVDEANLNMNLLPSSPAHSIPGWQDIPFDAIGTHSDSPVLQIKWVDGGIDVRGRGEPFASIAQAQIIETGHDVSMFIQRYSNGNIKGFIPSAAVTSATVTLGIVMKDPQQDLSDTGVSNTVGFIPCDIVPDGHVNLYDLVEMIEQWLLSESSCYPFITADLTGNCRVDFEDFLFFGNFWMRQWQD